VFSDTSASTVQASISLTSSGDLFGASIVELSASESSGDNLTYQWSINAQTTDATYTLSTASSESTRLSFTEPSISGDVSIYLTITAGDQTSTQVLTLAHQPQVATSEWHYQQVLTEELALTSGDTVQMRVVLESGLDVYIPDEPIELTTETATAMLWPLTLATAVNAENSHIAIGILDSNTDIVEPVESGTENNIYSTTSSSVASVFLNIMNPKEVTDSASMVDCYYELYTGEWIGGFMAKIVIENNSSETIFGWEVSWSYTDGSSISQIWNADVNGSYSATNLPWNATINPGDRVEFGFTGVSASSNAEIPEVTGDICQ
jgi:chitin-binding protein